MSVNIKQSNGTLKKIAGNTILLDATCSEIRSGTFSIQCVGNSGANTSITFETPMSDTDYVVIFESNSPAAGEVGFRNKTTTGFGLYVLGGRGDTEVYTFTGKYYAFRLVELEGYNAIYNKMTNIDTSPTENSTNLVTSGGVYDAIKNASSVFVGTAAEWAAETSKTDFNVALITDSGTVNAVDDTTGDTEIVANKHLVFTGTLSEWEALSVTEKKAFDEALITNDMDTGEVVNAVTDGDMRAVTSNAVYDYLTPTEISTTGTTVSQSSATIDSIHCMRSGNTVTIYGQLSEATLTNISSTTIKLTLPNAVPAAVMLTTGAIGYWGGEVDEACYCHINNGRTLTIFSNIDDSPISGVHVRFSVTYICE